MKFRVLGSLLGVAALWLVVGLRAQEGAKNAVSDKKTTEIRDDAALEELKLHRQFKEFQEQVLKLKQRLERSPRAEDRERAATLQRVLDKAQDFSISTQFEKVVDVLKKDNFSNIAEIKQAADQTRKLAEDLRELVALLREDSRAKKLQDESAKLKDLIKQIERTILQQKQVQGQTDVGKTDPKELKSNQGQVTDAISRIAKAMEGRDGKGGEAKDNKGASKDGGKGEGKKGETKDQGKGSEGKKGETKDQGKDSKGSEGKQGEAKGGEKAGAKSSEGQQGEAKSGSKGSEAKEGGAKGSKGSEGKQGASKESKGGQGKDGDPKEGGSKDAGKDKGGVREKTAEAKGGEKKETGNKNNDTKQGEAKSGAKNPDGKQGGAKDSKSGSESKPGDSKSGGDPKQGEAKPGSKSQGQGQAKSGGQPKEGSPQADQKGDPKSPPPSSNPKDNPQIGKKQVQEAETKSNQAEDQIAKKKPKEASTDQGDVIKKLEDAKKKLEDLLRQIREEELERLLAALQARCERMLAMQIEVLAGTESVHKAVQNQADKKPARENQIESAKLSDKEKDIVGEATKAIELLEAEGSAVAFPEVFQQVREDMKHVQRRLDVTDVGTVTQAIEKDIIDTLKEMIEALKKARKDMDDKKSPPGESKASPPQDQKLLEQIAELKMIRSLQLRVNARTQTYGRMYQGEQAAEPNIRSEIIGLAQRQERIFEVTNRIAKGDNK